MFQPTVRLTNAFVDAYDNSVATARTCYSSTGLVTEKQVRGEHLGDPEKREKALGRRDGLAESIFKATHHTTLQHAHFQFGLEGISRHFTWAFLHSHKWYNSEQLSQRYTTVTPENVVVPDFGPQQASEAEYVSTVQDMIERYNRLIDVLMPTVEAAYRERFPGRPDKKVTADCQKKAQEVARYILPVGVSTVMYHTVSALTLLRMYRTAKSDQHDCPAEAEVVVRGMVDAVIAADPDFAKMVDLVDSYGPLPEEPPLPSLPWSAAPTKFDLPSTLVSFTHDAERLLAVAIGQVDGLFAEPKQHEIEKRIARAMRAFGGEALNLDPHGRLTRALDMVNYVFQHQLSHTADSQDQRHRTTPAARPSLVNAFPHEPDYITPTLIRKGPQEAQDLYHKAMEDLWDKIGVIHDQTGAHNAVYLLPNAVTIRYLEAASLMALKHKMRMRLCLNAQEEIFHIAVAEAQQIAITHPIIGKHLLPPCGHRFLAEKTPPCPEGDRFCGVRAWDHLDDLLALVGKRGIL